MTTYTSYPTILHSRGNPSPVIRCIMLFTVIVISVVNIGPIFSHLYAQKLAYFKN